MAKIIGGTTSTTMRIPEGYANRPWVQINEGKDTQSADAAKFEFTVDEPYTELYIEGEIIISTTAAAKTIYMRLCKGTTPVCVSGAISSAANGYEVSYHASGTISPTEKCLFESVAGKSNNNTANVAANAGRTLAIEDGSFKGLTLSVMTSDPVNFFIGAGSVIKVWGR